MATKLYHFNLIICFVVITALMSCVSGTDNQSTKNQSTDQQTTGKQPSAEEIQEEPASINSVQLKGTSVSNYKENFYKTSELVANKSKPKSEADEEGSYFAKTERMMLIWGPRLYPDGDCKRAAGAINSYAGSYTNRSITKGFMTGFTPVWQCLGPNGVPTATCGNQNGVGQMHRLTFDPRYNGTTNKTIYASSSYGGLWRSNNDGLNWVNVNTDLLPFCSVADVCINPKNPNQIFIATGYADDGFAEKYDANWYHANPIFTIGIYRTSDGGINWKAINSGFLPAFAEGGTCRRIIINPVNPDFVIVATTRGLYLSKNATLANPTWELVLTGLSSPDIEFRGLEFKPNNPGVVYASGTDIYKSVDGGISWNSMTGMERGIDLRNDPNFTVKRINIAVTPAAAEKLFAYVEGFDEVLGVEGCKILMFNNNQWQIIHSQSTSGGGTNLFTSGYLGITVSPINANKIYYGNSIVWGSDNYPTLPFEKKADYFNSTGFHADVHDLKFQPLPVRDPAIFCAHDGGISVKTFPCSPAVQGWSYRSEGLSVATMWAFDDGDALSYFAMSGHQDCGTNIYLGNSTTNKWTQIKGGDGYSARINDADPTLAFHSGGNNSFYRFKLTGTTYTTNTEINKLPPDPTNTGGTFVRVPKTFPMVNHPISKKMVFGFTEVFDRLLDIPETLTPVEQVWKINSNVFQTIFEDWRRQITEMEIAPSNPDIIYVVTGGQQNEATSSWQLESTLLRGTTNPSNPTGPLAYTEKVHPGKNINPTKLAIVTAIAVDPVNANRIWITYTGYWDQFKVWFSGDGGTTWTNADPNGTLFNIPVNAIVYQNGTKDRLFIGTDAGIYMSEDGSEWQKYGSFPNVRVTEMKINKSINKLRVATYGRGLWEGTLPPIKK
jgi:hypothetical protein